MEKVNKIKLSEAQKLVIKSIRAGNNIFINDGYSLRTIPMGRFIKVRDSTIDSLEGLGMLDGLKLTERGKSIQL